MLRRRRRPSLRQQTGEPPNQNAYLQKDRGLADAEQRRKGKKQMNIMTNTTTLPHAGACGEPMGVCHSNGEDMSPAAERDAAAKTVLPSRARCLGPSGESLNIDARHGGHRDSFRRPGFTGSVHSCHTRRHWGNSNRARRCSIRSQDHAGHRRPGVRPTTPDDLRRSMHDAFTVVVGIPHRIVLQNGRVLVDSELDDDP
jgi:hypothetical protein